MPSLSRNASASEVSIETVSDFLRQQGFTQDTIDIVLNNGVKTPTELLNLPYSQAQELASKLKKVQQKRLLQLFSNPSAAAVAAPPPSPSVPIVLPAPAVEYNDEDADPLEMTERFASGGELRQQKRMEDMYMQTIIEAQTDRRGFFTSRAIDVLQMSRQQHQNRSRRLLPLIRDAPSSSEAAPMERAVTLGPVRFRTVLRLHAFEHPRDTTTFNLGEAPVDFTKSKVPVIMAPAPGSEAMTMRRPVSGGSSSSGGSSGKAGAPSPSGGGKGPAVSAIPGPAAVRRGDLGSGMSGSSGGKKSGDALPMAHFPAAPSHAVAPGVTPKVTSWACTVCKSSNGSENKLCTTCHTVRNPGEWCCKRCRTVNNASDAKCTACNEYNGEVMIVLPDLGKIGSGFIKGVERGFKALADEFRDMSRPPSPPRKRIIWSFQCGRCKEVMKFVSDRKEEAALKRPTACAYCGVKLNTAKVVHK